MMRIAYVCTDPGVPAFGTKGASVHVQAVLRQLVERGHEVHLLTPRTGGEPPADLSTVTVHALPVVRTRDPATREHGLAHADAAVRPLLARLAAQAPLDLVYERYALWGRTATTWATDHGVPTVLEVNAPLLREQAAHRVLVDVAAATAVAREAFAAAGVVACVSEPVAAWAGELSQRPAAIHVVPNGVDTRRVRPGARTDDEAFTVGFVGTLKPWHGVSTLLGAVALMAPDAPDVRLLLVGDGPQAGALGEQARAAGVAGRVEFTGAVDPSAVPLQLNRMDVAVAPYPDLADFYFSPLKVYEYFAAGLPVVASQVGPLPDLLEGRDGPDRGVLVEPDDAGALAEALMALRADPVRRAALGANARAAAVENHDWSGVVSRVLDLALGSGVSR